MFAAPTMVRRMVDCAVDIDPTAIRMIAWGGAPMLVSDVVGALDRFGPCMAQLYGQGESPMTITLLTRAEVADRAHPRWLERIGSAGIASPAVELCVAGHAGDPLAIGETGEVLVRGDSVMLGYWNDSEATAAALQDGWLHTGDLGSIDDHGYLTLKDRSKDVIISAGSNIYPREVEEVLISHPGVLEVSVIGRPDPDWGEIVVAYVVGNVATKELDKLCLERIARFKRPKEYVFLNALPKNNYGKIMKSDLRELDRTHAGSAYRTTPGGT
jgi:long-chain acyl-CoA synthetase